MLLKPSKFRFLLSTVKSKQYSTTSTAVKLSFDKFSIKASNEPPVLICHGLFGSKQNWSSLAKVMSNRLSRDVYTIVRSLLFSATHSTHSRNKNYLLGPS